MALAKEITGNLGQDVADIMNLLAEERRPDGRVVVFNPAFLQIVKEAAEKLSHLFMGDIDIRPESAELPAYNVLVATLIEVAGTADMLATHRAKYPNWVSKPGKLQAYPAVSNENSDRR